ncbi:MAG: hydroxymethylglutaryl-CoA lyase [Bacteriovoracaceae bacterium]|nr:hydroxymethylglutaryl-CoA lyase [Bacteriovoracaceae bacterium]
MFEKFPKNVKIVEVSPRDGLQSESTIVSLSDKLAFIDKLVASGLLNIEIGSFVRPDIVPQMANTKQLAQTLLKSQSQGEYSGVSFSCLVPNMYGFKQAAQVGICEVSVIIGASDEFNLRNTNMDIKDNLEQVASIAALAKKQGVRVRGSVAVAFGYNVGTPLDFDNLQSIVANLFKMGIDEICLCDTVGIATPAVVDEVLSKFQKQFDLDRFCMHFHNTMGMGLVNTMVALNYGISNFDTSVGDMGGCPNVVGINRNVKTEDLVYMLDSLNIETGIDLDAVSSSIQSLPI